MEIEYLVDKYSKLVYKICYDMLTNSLDAEDITQEVYISLFSNLERYRDLPENEIKNIICKIALNKCKDVFKSKAKKLERMTDSDIISLENYVSDNDIEESILKNEKNEYISKIINELKEPYRDVLCEYYLNERSLDEIAQKYNISKGTLKMQIHRGKKLLKEKLSGGENLL